LRTWLHWELYISAMKLLLRFMSLLNWFSRRLNCIWLYGSNVCHHGTQCSTAFQSRIFDMCNPLIVSVSSCSIASRIAVDVYLVSFGSYSPCVECGIRANFPFRR
jgi:hypothetical protein